MKNYIKKIMAWIVIASITIGIASGCSKSEREKENKEDKKVITLMSSTNHVRDVDRKLAEKFEKETGIHVDFQLTVGDQYADAVMACLQSGEGPDIFMGQVGTELESFQPDIYALDLSNEAWVKKYPDWVKEQMTYDGKMVGFTTWGRDLRAMVYNKNLLKNMI